MKLIISINNFYFLLKNVFNHLYEKVRSSFNYNDIDNDDIIFKIIESMKENLFLTDIQENNLIVTLSDIITDINYNIFNESDWNNKVYNEIIKEVSKNSTNEKFQSTMNYVVGILKTYYSQLHFRDNPDFLNELKLFIYLIPIYVVNMYVYDIYVENNSEKAFFANLSYSFMQHLDY